MESVHPKPLLDVFTYVLFLVYFLAVFVFQIWGVITIGLVLLLMLMVVGAKGACENVTIDLPIFLVALLLLMIGLLSSFFWKYQTMDIKDALGFLMFFFMIPFITFSFFSQSLSIEVVFDEVVKIVFWILSVILFLFHIKNGIDWERAEIYHINRNGLSIIFETIAIYLGYQYKKNKQTFKFILIFFVGILTLVMIGGKTAILITTIVFFRLLLIKPIYVGFMTLFIVLFIFPFIQENDIEQSYFKTLYFRSLLWDQAFSEMEDLQALLLGNGPGTFVSQVDRFGLLNKTNIHSYPIKILHNFGLIFFAVFISYIILLFRKMPFYQSSASFVFWIFAIHSLIDVGWVMGPGFVASIFQGKALYQSKKNQ